MQKQWSGDDGFATAAVMSCLDPIQVLVQFVLVRTQSAAPIQVLAQFVLVRTQPAAPTWLSPNERSGVCKRHLLCYAENACTDRPVAVRHCACNRGSRGLLQREEHQVLPWRFEEAPRGPRRDRQP